MTGSIVIPTGQKVTLSDQPSTGTDAANKTYVDSLVSSGTTWRNPVVDVDVNDVVSAVPGSPLAGATYIAYGGSYPQNWGTGATVVISSDIVTRKMDNSGWQVIKNLAVGDRILFAAEHGSISSGLVTAGFFNHDLAQYVSGDPSLTSSWMFPDGRGSGGAPEIAQGVTVLCSSSGSEHQGHTYLYDNIANTWVEIAGPGSVGAGVGLSYSGTMLNVNLGAGVVALPSDEVGLDLYSTSGLFLTTDGTTSDTTSAGQLSVKLDGSTIARSASGIKISPAGVTSTEIAASALGAGLTGGSGSSIALATSGVTASTYKSVTVDVYGRVTAGSNPITLAGFGITDAAPLSHVSDTSSHLTSSQNTWIDGISATSAEVNYSVGVTSGIQSQFSNKQPLDGDLTSIAALVGTSGFLKKTAADTWALDTNTYLTTNQNITVSGDATGSGGTSISLTLANTGVTASTYKSVTVDSKGRVTAGSNPTTLAGFGITDAQPLSSELTAEAGLTTTGVIVRNGSGSRVIRTITGTAGRIAVANGNGVSGDPTVDLIATAVTAGVYGSASNIPVVTVDAYGRLTNVATVAATGGGGGTTNAKLYFFGVM